MVLLKAHLRKECGLCITFLKKNKATKGENIRQFGTHLANYVPVGEPDNHPVLGCVVLVLVLDYKALTCKVVRLPLLKMISMQNNIVMSARKTGESNVYGNFVTN